MPRRENRCAGASAVALALLVAAAAHGVAASDATGPAETVLARTGIPSEERKVGEVRLLRRGSQTVVQTLLVSRVLPRVVAEIRDKEIANWPESDPDHGAMTAYVAGLEASAARLRSELPEVDARSAGSSDRKLRLAIEFTASEDTAGVAIAAFDSTDASPFDVLAKRVLSEPSVSRRYVLRNMRLIVADAFDVAESRAGSVGPLGPAASPP